MKYLVTGGAGFIGSHLCRTLVKMGHEVLVLDDLSIGSKEVLPPEVTLLIGNICDYDLCLKATEGVDGVFHMAAFSRSGPSFDMPELCHKSNSEGTLTLLMACRKNQVKRIVYSGSSTFYGNKIGVQKESDPGDFLNFYGLTKHIGELYIQQYHKNFGLEANILRYFNVYGPGQPSTGTYALVLGIFLNRFFQGQHLEIHGTGEQRRDFIHVLDVVKANIAAMQSEVVGEIFNIGSGLNYSINEIASYFPQEKIYTPRRSGDAEETLADISKAIQLLKWKPEISLEKGIKDLMNERHFN